MTLYSFKRHLKALLFRQ